MPIKLPSRGSDQFQLRLPDGMRDRLKTRAENNGRSMNTEIVACIEAVLDRDGEAASASGELAKLVSELRGTLASHDVTQRELLREFRALSKLVKGEE